MVDVGHKQTTQRTAIAVSSVRFSNADALRLINENGNKKGDVLGVARIAGIMAAKRCSDLIPLCHPIPISKVSVSLYLLNETGRVPWATNFRCASGAVLIEAQVHCSGVTGVEMEALTAASTAALTVYDMCKAVDRDMDIQAVRVLSKTGGASGDWTSQRYQHWLRWKEMNGSSQD